MALKKTGYEFWNDVLHSPRYIAAPMVDMSELPFRELCRQHGSQLCFTPMLHSQQFVQDFLYRQDCFSTSPVDRPLIVQFCANDPNVFVNAANLVVSECDAIDLNLGCPQAIAKKGHYGAYLQDEWDLIHSIVRKASDELPIPVTCKMRIMSGPSARSVDYAKMLENAGCSVITIHGRRRYQKGHNTGLASWDIIRDVKANVKIPVIANGNILTYNDVHSCLEYTQADAVMSAEALLHNPALFSGKNPPVWEITREYLTLAEKYNTPLRHVRNHMYRVLYLCLHQDTKLRLLLENAGTFSDFYQICESLEKLSSPSSSDQNLADKDIKIDGIMQYLNLSKGEISEFGIAESVSSCPHQPLCDKDAFNCCDTTFVSDTVEIVNSQEVSQNTTSFDHAQSDHEPTECFQELVIGENMFSSDDEELAENQSLEYCPIWLCHSRPRINLNSGNRGCYSKYFEKSEEQASSPVNSPESYLSKRQQRRARHYARVLASMKENRKAKKLRRKQKILELKENNNEEIKTKIGEKMTKQQQRAAIRVKLKEAQNKAPKICIDLGYSSEMSNKELNRLSTQLRRLYGSNRQSKKPFHLYFCNFHSEDPLFEICSSKNDGFDSYVIDMVEKSPEDLFTQDELFYLSPDSENVISSIEPSKIYVIGGIVDGSVKKGLSLSRAKGLDVMSGRLPVLEHFERTGETSGNTVLTVNQVFDILLKFYETEDWVEALCAGIPSRKGFRIRKSLGTPPPDRAPIMDAGDATIKLSNE